MAKLTIQKIDIGFTIPLSGDLFWDVVGISSVDMIDVAAGTKAKLSLGGSVDTVHFEASSTEYTVKMSGTSAIFTHSSSGAEVTIPMTTEGDKLQFGDGSWLNLRIDTSSGTKFMLGTQELTTTPTPIADGGVIEMSLDGKGTNETPFPVDALNETFNFIDSALQSNNVLIENFGEDDQITISGATKIDYDTVISSDANGDVTIAYNNNGVLNQIVITGVGTAFDVDSFNALAVGDLIFT